MPQNLIMTEAEWSTLRHKLSDPFFQRVHENNERACDVLITQGGEDFWSMSRDLTQPELARSDPWFWRIAKQRLMRFAVSWRLTAREECRVEALRVVDVVIDPTQWIKEMRWDLKHADLRTADWWTNAAFALEALAPILSPRQKSGLIQLLLEWALPTYLRGIEEGDWWRYAEFNWGAAVHGAGGVAALAMADVAPELSERALHAAKRGLRFVIANFPSGGFWTEGLMYQTTTITHMTEFVAALHRLTGDHLGLIGHPRLRDSLDSRLWMIGGDRNPLNLSNINEVCEQWRLPAAYWWAQQFARPDWAGFEDAFPRLWQETVGIAYEVETLWWRALHQESTPWEQPVGLCHGRELDWLSWKRGSAWLAFRAGFNGGNHNNLDLGQVIFGFEDQRLLGDPGYGHSATSVHSCITLRNRDQTMDATAHILRADEYALGEKWLLHICCDLKECYPHTLDHHHRHVVAFSDGTLIFIDKLISRHHRRIGARGHLQLKAKAEEKGDDWSMATKQGEWQIRSHFPLRWRDASPGETQGSSLHTLSYAPHVDCPNIVFGVSLSLADPPVIKELNAHQISISLTGTSMTLDTDSGVLNL